MRTTKEGVERVREIKDSAFGRYLLSIPRDAAVGHLRQCLDDGHETKDLIGEILDGSGITLDPRNVDAGLEAVLKRLEDA